jgi:gamma-glutamyltranspeptidase/glutathione hydrolase
VACVGTPGGDQQDQLSLLLLLRIAHHGMTRQQTIDAPAFHTSVVAGTWVLAHMRPVQTARTRN